MSWCTDEKKLTILKRWIFLFQYLTTKEASAITKLLRRGTLLSQTFSTMLCTAQYAAIFLGNYARLTVATKTLEPSSTNTQRPMNWSSSAMSKIVIWESWLKTYGSVSAGREKWYFKMGPQVQPKCFRHPQHMRNNWELRKRGYLIRFGHTEALL